MAFAITYTPTVYNPFTNQMDFVWDGNLTTAGIVSGTSNHNALSNLTWSTAGHTIDIMFNIGDNILRIQSTDTFTRDWNFDAVCTGVSCAGSTLTIEEISGSAGENYIELQADQFTVASDGAGTIKFLNITDEGSIFDSNVTLEKLKFENSPENHTISDNSTCMILTGDTSTITIC